MTEIFQISNGTDTINLISGSGIILGENTVGINQMKGGGNFVDSPIAAMRALLSRNFATSVEAMTLSVVGDTQDEVLGYLAALVDILEQALEYWLEEDNETLVYMACKAENETNVRYALIHSYKVDDAGNQYGNGFEAGGYDGSTHYACVLPGINLAIERGHWQPNIPGSGTAVQTSSVQTWPYYAAWAVETTTASDFWCVFQASSGRVFAGENGQIVYSDDNGDSWGVSTTSPTGAVFFIMQTSSGRIIAGDSGQIWKSDNNGGSWAAVGAVLAGNLFDCIELSNGDLIIVGNDIYRSDDDGDTWAVEAAIANPYTLVQTDSGRIIATDATWDQISIDNGLNWTSVGSPNSNLARVILKASNGSIVRCHNEFVYLSLDDGDVWQLVFTDPGPSSYLGGTVMADGTILIGNSDAQIYASFDNGHTWQLRVDFSGTANINDIAELASGHILSAEDVNMRRYLGVNTTSMGNEATTAIVPIANKSNVANLTHIFVDDGGAYGSNLIPMTSFPVDLLPAVPAVNDAIYFTIDESVENTGPFSSLVFDLATITGGTFVWEYSDTAGPTWATLDVMDNTSTYNGTTYFSFTKTGVLSVHWTPPTDWTKATVNGVTGYWIRVRVASVGTATASIPTQQNRSIYTLTQPYVEIAAAQVGGGTDALANILAANISDKDGRGSNLPNLFVSRVVVGLRKYSRGSNFNAFINLSDQQLLPGVTVDATGTNASFATEQRTATGRYVLYNPAGVEAMATQATVSFGPGVAHEFYGKFHAFLRGQRDAGSASDIEVQLQVVSASGGVGFTTRAKQFPATSFFGVLDFGRIRIPVGSASRASNPGDLMEIRIQASAASGTPNLLLFDLILIPVDEWAGDFQDTVDNNESLIARDDGVEKRLNIDSISNPKIDISANVEVTSSGFRTAEYKPISPEEAILRRSARQRLWFLMMRTSSTGSGIWTSTPEICTSVQVLKSERYLISRGSS